MLDTYEPEGLTVPVEMLDFRNFVTLAFEHLGLDEPTESQYEIAEYMQYGPSTLQVQALRGQGKSILAELFCVWCLYVAYAGSSNPEYAILAASAAGNRAYQFSTFCLNLINTWDELAFLRPKPDGRTSTKAFDVGPAPVQDSPSMKSMGITSQIAGSRANCIVLDDVEAANNSATQVQREKLLEMTREVAAVVRPLPPEESLQKMFPHLAMRIIKQIMWRILVLGTPQTEDTIYTEFSARGYEKRIWPARFPGKRWMTANGIYLAPRLLQLLDEDPSLAEGGGDQANQGQPCDRRFGEMDLQQRELQYGRSGFALQFMLDTSLADADRYPLKLNDLIVMDLNNDVAPERLIWTSDPDFAWKDLDNVGFNGDRYHKPLPFGQDEVDWIPYQGTVMAIDPAGRGKDETSVAIVSALNSFLYVRCVKGYGPGSGYEDDVLEDIAKTAAKYGVRKIVAESNFGDGMFEKLLAPHLRRHNPCIVEGIHMNQQKERRIIDTLEPVMNGHRLVVCKSVVEEDRLPPGSSVSVTDQLRYKLMYQMSRLTREKGSLLHDDRLDALALAVGVWVESMALDAQIQMRQRRADAMDRELKRHIEFSYGGGVQPDTPRNWIQSSGVMGR